MTQTQIVLNSSRLIPAGMSHNPAVMPCAVD